MSSIKPLLFLAVFIFISCKKEPSLSFINDTVTTPENTMVTVSIPKAVGGENISKAINQHLNSKLIDIISFAEIENTPKSIEESINKFNSDYNAFKSDFPDSPMTWEADVYGEIIYQSPQLISVSITSYVFTGGAHGIQTVTFMNFDPKSGDILNNDTLFKDLNGFETLAEGYFKNHIKGKEQSYFDGENSFSMPEDIGFNKQGVILFYNPYEIAPYATGVTELLIPYNEANAFLALELP